MSAIGEGDAGRNTGTGMPFPGTRLPLIAAPMAGGPSTPELVVAVSAAGGFGFLAGGYKSRQQLGEQITVTRSAGVSAFGVNLFVPTPVVVTDVEFATYSAGLAGDAVAAGVELPTDLPRNDDDDHWAEKLDLLVTDPVPVVSFTFGIPEPGVIAALRNAGSTVLLTVTTVDEADSALAAYADGLVVQGGEAGGHSGTHDPSTLRPPSSAVHLTRAVAARTGRPLIACGGVSGPDDVAALLDAGASAVAVGTLLLRCDEAGTSQTHRAALGDPRFTRTVVTRAFTGRPARALANAFTDRHDARAPLGYPALHHLTRELRAAAGRAGDPDLLHLWAGTGYRNARTGPAAEIIAELAAGVTARPDRGRRPR